MKKKSPLMLLFAFVVVFSACKKKEDPKIIYEEKALLLAGNKGQSKTWLLTEYKILTQQGTAPEQTFLDFSTSPNCTKDDEFVFINNANQDYESNEGATKCASGDPQLIERGNWFFSNDAMWVTVNSDILRSQEYGIFTNLSQSIGLGSLPGKVMELTDASLKMTMSTSFVTQNNTTVNVRVVMSFRKK